ncbi:Insertion element IS1 1/2/3/5/6 protein insA (IS1a/IS1b/IS1c/IS1d) (modular protein) [Xenorhabdus nematophila str. Anatoliense]|nr:Insertion element IS1 1/2/3/5/6 protein insA (IS1a/IS1b/IS1c/IS1d) (modular protein) [Xenorhabdus nematophila str. Anatoliense]CEE95933.1 Insertion element IS1 1/2/3/5/6 protein insA (IS1a/IS1b/IS1c/IS1d) (modular protein) [Xenorhabdus nematophila str. Anatoliense]
MAKVEVDCRHCHKSEDAKGHGKGHRGYPRYRCYACSKVFQLAYTYQACKPGVKEQIIDMAMNNSGIRDTARVLKVATAAVMKTLKNLTPGTGRRFLLTGMTFILSVKWMSSGRLWGVRKISAGSGMPGSRV